MADHAPCARERLGRAFGRLHDLFPGRGRIGRARALDGGGGIREQRIERGRNMFGADFIKARQIRKVEQRIGRSHCASRDLRTCFKAYSAAWSVFISSMPIVIGPTPPGTGVIKPATFLTASKSTSPQSLPSAVR